MSIAHCPLAENTPPLVMEEPSILIDDEMRRLAQEDDCVMQRTSAARGTVAGLVLGAALWALCILAGIATFHR